MTEEIQKSMFGTMILFLAVIMLSWQVIAKLAPIFQEFFSEQEWLMGIISSYPLVSIILFSFLMSSYTNLFYKFGISKETLEKMKLAKHENREMQKKLRELRNEPEKMMKMQKEMMSKSMHNSFASMGTMFSKKFIFLVSLPSLCFLFLVVGPIFMAANVGYIFNWGFSLFGRTGSGWLLTLILLSLILTPITKKIFKLDF